MGNLGGIKTEGWCYLSQVRRRPASAVLRASCYSLVQLCAGTSRIINGTSPGINSNYAQYLQSINWGSVRPFCTLIVDFTVYAGCVICNNLNNYLAFNYISLPVHGCTNVHVLKCTCVHDVLIYLTEFMIMIYSFFQSFFKNKCFFFFLICGQHILFMFQAVALLSFGYFFPSCCLCVMSETKDIPNIVISDTQLLLWAQKSLLFTEDSQSEENCPDVS